MASKEFEEIVEDFILLEDWEDRYGYVIDLGKAMTPLEEELRVPALRVEGCASRVWIMFDISSINGKMIFSFKGESDAIIVRGLIAILKALFNGVELSYVHRIDAHHEFERIGLRAHLSSQRSNGLTSMINKIQQVASESCESPCIAL